MEIGANPSPRVLGNLASELRLSQSDIDQRAGLIDHTILGEVADLDRSEHRWPQLDAGGAAASGGRVDMFSVIRQGDLLVHHPFESFEAGDAVHQRGGRDPDVLAIKQTIYRTNKDSPFVTSLIRAAGAASRWQSWWNCGRGSTRRERCILRALEKAGTLWRTACWGTRRTAKAALVVRRERGLRTYCHLGTGNYNPKTATLYTRTWGSSRATRASATTWWNCSSFLTGRSRLDTYETLLVAGEHEAAVHRDDPPRGADQNGTRGESPVPGADRGEDERLADRRSPSTSTPRVARACR